MIRINLLGTPKAKGKRSAAAMPMLEVGDAGSPKLKILVVLAVTAALATVAVTVVGQRGRGAQKREGKRG